MPEQEFEIYLSVLSRLLRLSPKQKDAIADELRDHLEERLAELMQSGMSREEAVQTALDDFGDVSGLAIEMTNVSRIPLRRLVVRTTLAASAIAVLVTCGLFLFSSEPAPGPRLVRVAQADQEQAEPTTKPQVAAARSVFMNDDELFPTFLTAECEFNFSDTPLTDACEYLREKHKMTVLLDKEAFEAAAIPTDTPVTLNLKDLTVEEALNHILRPLNLGWRVDGDIVMVSPVDVIQSELLTKEYDLAPLLKMGYSNDALISALRVASQGGWESDGSGIGRLSMFDDVVVVRQTYQSQRRIARLLALLERPQSTRDLGMCSHIDRLHAALKKTTECRFADTPLNDAIDFLAVSNDVPILLDLGELKIHAVAVDSPTTLSLTNKPLDQVLRLLLKPLKLTYIIREGLILVTSNDTAQSWLVTAAYDVRDLVKHPANALADEDKLEQLQRVIVDSTSDAWEENGGSGKLVRMEPGILVIAQTDAVHREIDTLLTRLRQQAKLKPQMDAKPTATKLVTKSYMMSKEAASDLVSTLPKLVAEASWSKEVNGELPLIQQVSAEPRLQEIEGRVVQSPFEVRQLDPPTPAKPEPGKPAPAAPMAPTKNIVVRPQASLVIRQTPENHRAIESLLRNLTQDPAIIGVDPTKPNFGGGFGGGGFF